MPESDRVKIDKVYDLINQSRRDQAESIASMRADLKADINRVENKFDTMEAGRLTRLEQDFVAQKATLKAWAVIFGVVWAVVQSVITAVIINIVAK